MNNNSITNGKKLEAKTDFLARRLALTLLALLTVTNAWTQISHFSVTNSGNVFTITRDNTTTVERVQYRTVSVSALAGIHFTEESNTLVFNIGDESKSVTVYEKPSANIPLLYRYQNSNRRMYRFEVLDMGGFQITSKSKYINYNNSYTFTNDKVAKNITDLVYIKGSIFASLLGSDRFVDVSYNPATNPNHNMTGDGYILIDDEYAYNNKTLCVVSTSDLIDATGATREYHNNIGNKMYATVCFTEKEGKDGYAYIQILADQVALFDGEDQNGEVYTPVRSLYKSCFELYKGSHVYTSDAKQFFPHRYNYHNRSEETANNVPYTSFPMDESYLWQQKYKANSYAAANSGALVLDPTVNNICVRFDAGGQSNDTWYIKNLFVRLVMCDEKAPVVLSDDIAINAGDHKKGNYVAISIPFNEIVRIVGNTKYLNTTWGDLNYADGDGTNVLTFRGFIQANEGTTLAITGRTFDLHDQSGNSFDGSLNKTFNGVQVEANYEYSINYNLDGGVLAEANPTSYNYSSDAITLNNPSRKGYFFIGWTGSNGNTPNTTLTINTHSNGDRYYVANWEKIPSEITGSGTKDDPYCLRTAKSWEIFTNNINSGVGTNAYYKLENDITLGTEENPITTVVGTFDHKFKGHFDGDYHTIHLHLKRYEDYAALFGIVEEATFENINVDGTIWTDHKFAGAIAGWIECKDKSLNTYITNCISSVHITCDSIVTVQSTKPFDCTHGGFVGQNEKGVINFKDCLFDGWIRDHKETKTANKCAGFIGWVNDTVKYTNCMMAGVIDVKENDDVLKNSMATYHRKANNAYEKFIGDNKYINNYTYKLREQGTPALKSEPKNMISRVYNMNGDSYYFPYVDISSIESTMSYTESTINLNPSLNFFSRKLLRDTDFTASITPSAKGEGGYRIYVAGMGDFVGSNCKNINVAIFNNEGLWGNQDNWINKNMPGSGCDVILTADVTIPAEYIANVANISIQNDATITIEDGGQLICESAVEATVQKTIDEWNDSEKSGWYLISSPINDLDIASTVNGLHNVYRYNEKEILWEEYRSGQPGYKTFQNGRGYLYRSSEGKISFEGKIMTDDVVCNLSNACENESYKGFNLIGNPYTHDIYKGVAISNDNLEDGYCIMDTDGTWKFKSDSEAIPSCAAILVQAKPTDKKKNVVMTNTAEAPSLRANNDNIWFTVKSNKYEDVARVEFKEGHGFNKMAHYNENAPMLYIIHDGENFASVDMSDDTEEINLGFKTNEMGKYTLSLDAKGNYNYLHIIDKMSGEDVDMLVEDEYSFIASSHDIDSRFIVKLSYNATSNVDNDIFAWKNGSDIMVKGNGELQIFDVMGRMVVNTYVNGFETISKPSKGVYIFRLVGNEMKTQKIVVR